MDSTAEMGNGEDSANTKLLQINKSDNMLQRTKHKINLLRVYIIPSVSYLFSFISIS